MIVHCHGAHCRIADHWPIRGCNTWLFDRLTNQMPWFIWFHNLLIPMTIPHVKLSKWVSIPLLSIRVNFNVIWPFLQLNLNKSCSRFSILRLYVHIPSLTQVYVHIPPLTQVYVHIPSLTQVYVHIPSLTQVYVHIPSLTQVHVLSRKRVLSHSR